MANLSLEYAPTNKIKFVIQMIFFTQTMQNLSEINSCTTVNPLYFPRHQGFISIYKVLIRDTQHTLALAVFLAVWIRSLDLGTVACLAL